METEVLELNLWSIIESIEWHDPLVIGIIMFHIAVTSMAILTRNHNNFQVVLFLALLLLVYFSESLNEYATNHWKLLSRQQYFDDKGMFISLIFSAPILLNCMVMMASWLWQSSELMVQLKNAQLKQIKLKSSPTLNKSDSITNSDHIKNE
ncbi:hypothetical protein O3M35_005715 [Rhynocoris fuscipes]|uniref:Transmembrane protein 18 n=1 Tax=Rhynocoris fuscipes TaxID=488301 RepID=A0AAW1DL81_9HEMI